MRCADYIVDTLVAHGITEAFVVVGGASMFLTDALSRHPDMRVTYMGHETACAMAAESYFRLTGKMAVVCVSSGPGSWQAAVGVWGAWVDGQAMVVLAGQCKRSTINMDRLRQLGDQEADMAFMHLFTKSCKRITNPRVVPEMLGLALAQATDGRPGPVWLEIPVDIQGTEIPTPQSGAHYKPAPPILDMAKVRQCMERLYSSSRPVILLGSGLRTAGVDQDELLTMLDWLHVPVVTAFNAYDLIPHDFPLLCGRQGTIGDRAGNFAVQSSDFLLVLGSRMSIRQVGYDWESCAPNAYKVMVDIDAGELDKPTFRVDLPIHADLKQFVAAMDDAGWAVPSRHMEWLAWCRERVARYPVVQPDMAPDNPYRFLDALWSDLRDDDIIVTGNASACIVTFQVAKIKKGQRLYSQSGAASMGWALPAAIGAARGANGRRVICIDGDGSFQMNIQELATVAKNNLNIKIIVLNNGGYSSIRQTQESHFPGNLHGLGEETGVGFPVLFYIAKAYGIPQKISLDKEDGPAISEVGIDPHARFAPRVKSKLLSDGRMVSPPLDDMYPFLDETEHQNNLWR